MSQIPALIDVVKKQLKAQGKTYQDVAEKLDLSEASVKRLFSEQNISLQRLEHIADLLGFEMAELWQFVAKQQQQITELSKEQEQEIANDITLLLVTVCVMNHYSFTDIVNDFAISETECIRMLAKLDKLKLIELLPNNRIKLLIAPNFKWLRKGPIQRFFQHKIQQDFFTSNFDKDTEKLMVLNGFLSNDSIKALHKRMQRLAEEFNALIHENKDTAIQDKHGITLVMAERQWEYSIFENYKKN